MELTGRSLSPDIHKLLVELASVLSEKTSLQLIFISARRRRLSRDRIIRRTQYHVIERAQYAAQDVLSNTMLNSMALARRRFGGGGPVRARRAGWRGRSGSGTLLERAFRRVTDP